MRARGAWLAALAGAGLAAGVGCNLIVGAGDYSVDAGVTEAEGGSPEAGSADGPPGTTDAAGDGAKPHDAGVDVVDAANYDAAPEAAAPCSSDLLDLKTLQPIIQACLLLADCLPGATPIASVSSCVTYDDPHRDPGLSCAAVTNASCSDVSQCFGQGYDISSDCASNEESVKCVGNKGVLCGADGILNVNEYFDCSVTGGTCSAFNVDGGVPNELGCVVVPSCTDPVGTGECSGTYAYQCIHGQGYGRSCAARLETCETRATTGCYFHDDTCGATATTCNAATNVLSICAYGYVESYDCTSSGLGCTLDSASNGYCLAPGCTPQSQCTTSCDADGHTMHLCIGNAPLTIDCKSYFYDPSGPISFVGCVDNGTTSAPNPTCY